MTVDFRLCVGTFLSTKTLGVDDGVAQSHGALPPSGACAPRAAHSRVRTPRVRRGALAGRAPREPRPRRSRGARRAFEPSRAPAPNHPARTAEGARLRRNDGDDPRPRLRQVHEPARAIRGRERRGRGPRDVGVVRRGHMRHARAVQGCHRAGDRQQRRRVVERAAAGVRRRVRDRADVHIRRLAAGVPRVYRARGVSGGAVAVGTREGTMGVGRRRGARRGGHDGAHILRERAAARQRRRPGYGRTVAAVASVDSPGLCADARPSPRRRRRRGRRLE